MNAFRLNIFILIVTITNTVTAVTITGPKMTWADVFRDRLEVKDTTPKRQQRSHHSTKKAFVLSHGFDTDNDHQQYTLQNLDQTYADGYYGQDLSKENLLATSQALKYLDLKDSYSKDQKTLKSPLSFIYTEAEQPQYVTETYKFVTVPEKYDAQSYLQGNNYYKLKDYEHNEDNYASKYKFGYRVSDPHTGAEFGHSEVSEGHVKKGHYHVLLPDGRLQNVKYWADPSGYHATVTYEGQAHHYTPSYPSYH